MYILIDQLIYPIEKPRNLMDSKRQRVFPNVLLKLVNQYIVISFMYCRQDTIYSMI